MMKTTAQEQKKGRKKIILLLLLLTILVAVGLYLSAGWQGYHEAPKLVELQDIPKPGKDSYTLSPDQENSLSSYGYPEAFTILYYEEDTTSGDLAPVRLETWDYYSRGVVLSFINGELVSEEALEISEIGTVALLPYSPEQFSAFMSLDKVIASAGIESYLEIPLDKEFIEDGVLYYAGALSFGIQDDKLIYVETLALAEY